MFTFQSPTNARGAALGCAATLALLLLFSPAVQSQVLYGSITGNVRDPNGASIAGATVTITNNETNLSRDAVTDESPPFRLAPTPSKSTMRDSSRLRARTCP